MILCLVESQRWKSLIYLNVFYICGKSMYIHGKLKRKSNETQKSLKDFILGYILFLISNCSIKPLLQHTINMCSGPKIQESHESTNGLYPCKVWCCWGPTVKTYLRFFEIWHILEPSVIWMYTWTWGCSGNVFCFHGGFKFCKHDSKRRTEFMRFQARGIIILVLFFCWFSKFQLQRDGTSFWNLRDPLKLDMPHFMFTSFSGIC